MWEEGQNWRGHTGKKRQKVGEGGGLKRQSPGIVQFCFVRGLGHPKTTLNVLSVSGYRIQHFRTYYNPVEGEESLVRQHSGQIQLHSQRKKWERDYSKPVFVVLSSREREGERTKKKDRQQESPTSGRGGSFYSLLCSVLDEVHLNYSTKDNYIMWVSATWGKSNIFIKGKSGQLTGWPQRGHLNITIISYPGKMFIIL